MKSHERGAESADVVHPGVLSSRTERLEPYRVQWLARIMYGDVFEWVVIAIILVNATALAILTYSDIPPQLAATAMGFDQFALIFYTIEVVLRLVSYGTKPWAFFRNPWNVFDFALVVAIPLLDSGTVVFRLLRLLRILRIFRFLPEARILMLSMIKSVAPLANLAVLIGFLMFIYAMAGVYIFGPTNPDQWGNIGLAMITLTVMLTLENFPDVFLSGLELTPWALLYFLSYLFFVVFTVLNVLIGIVLTAMDQARAEVHAQQEALTNPPVVTEDARDASPGDLADLDGLDAQLDAVALSTSPDHIRRIRDEIARLRAAQR